MYASKSQNSSGVHIAVAHTSDVANEPLDQNLAAINKAAINNVSVLKDTTRALGFQECSVRNGGSGIASPC